MEKDLIVVVPDGAILQIVQTLLGKRQRSLRIRAIRFELVKDPCAVPSFRRFVETLRGWFPETS